MASGNISLSFLSERARDILALTDIHFHRHLPAGVAQSSIQLRLPEVRISTRHFIDMGLRPEIAERLPVSFLKFVARYSRAFEFYFDRAVHGGRLPPEYYHDMFVILFKRTIRGWESQIISTWLAKTGVFSPDLRNGCIDIPVEQIRVDNATKNSILLKLGFQTIPLPSSRRGANYSVAISQSEDVCEKHDVQLLTLPVSPTISPVMTAPTSDDLRSRATPPTCFPTRYPPPPGESSTPPQSTFVTSFTRAALFDQMSVSGLEVGRRPRESSKGFPRCQKPKKTEPLPPLLSPIIVDASGTFYETLPTRIGSAPTPKPTPVKRRRRIAPLPNRHKSSDPPPSSDSLSSVISGTTLSSQGATSRVPSTLAIIIGETPLECADTSLGIFCRPTPLAQDSAEVPSPSMSKSGAPRQRKAVPFPRRVPPRPQGIFSSHQTPLPTLSGTSCPVSRSPSLVLDASSSSSSDELDTPPSTPPHVSSIRSTIDESTAIPPKANMLMSRRSPSLGDGVSPKPRERIIHIDLTKGVGGQERPLTFTFGV
ncbi:hypothetical protein BC827DRAFT_1263128 [Russula dissimulans]|nr:hypothetical protein BC827DRAFT_1263128 [Russula dissimulans]